MKVIIEIEYPGKYMPDSVGAFVKTLTSEDFDSCNLLGLLSIKVQKINDEHLDYAPKEG